MKPEVHRDQIIKAGKEQEKTTNGVKKASPPAPNSKFAPKAKATNWVSQNSSRLKGSDKNLKHCLEHLPRTL